MHTLRHFTATPEIKANKPLRSRQKSDTVYRSLLKSRVLSNVGGWQ